MKARLRRLLDHAQSLDGDWDDRAEAWWRVTVLAADTGELTVGMEASLRAVDAFRRADQPKRVLESVKRARELVHAPSAQAMLETYRLAALLDMGLLMDAEAEAEALLDDLSDAQVRPLALDTVAGIYFATGRVRALEELLEEMSVAEGPMVWGAEFRRSQIAALSGNPTDAEAGFTRCIEGLSGHPGTDGAVAAAWTEKGGIQRLLGRHDEALDCFERACALWDQSSRRAGRFLSEAERACAILATGGSYVPAALDKPIAFCVERGLLLLEARLRLARGLCRFHAGQDGSREDLNQAIAIPLEQGARLQAGRARFEVAKVSHNREAELARAHRELGVDQLAQQAIEQLLGGAALRAEHAPE